MNLKWPSESRVNVSSTAQVLVPGVLGGMGPKTTIDFLAKVIRETDAATDQEHLHLLIDHNPVVPDRTDAISGKGESAGPHLARMAQNLESGGADFLVLTCNSAHAYQSDIEHATSIPFISMVGEVMGVLADRFSSRRRVGVMAARGCLDAGLYQTALEAVGFEAVVWREPELELFTLLLEQIKADDVSQSVVEQVKSLAQSLIDDGAQVVIAGCAEIPRVLEDEMLRVPLLNPCDILVDGVIDYSLGVRSPSFR
ncbi:cysteate racemase [Woeseia oceani]|nr:amino acid racemase [Woeseia oceani]